jgi:pimeloyl-ACP methyl ester carboxylesterase
MPQWSSDMSKITSWSLAVLFMASLCAQAAADLGTIAGVESHFAKLEDNKVHYDTLGKGNKTIVLIHGWAGNTSLWREQGPALAEKARLILVDLPGHGRSDKPKTDYTLDYFARGVLAVMRDARVDKATLIGHSMGAPVICRVYAQAPEKVAGLVAVDGLLRRPELNPEQVEKFVGPFGQPDYRSHVTNFIYSMFPDPDTHTMRDQVLAEVMKTPHHVMASAMKEMFNASRPDWTLSKVTVPVMVLNAPNPRWTADYEAYVRGVSPKSDYRVIEDTHHCLMLQKPAEFNKALLSMLQKFGLIGE